jgi:membrane-bound lytic murein transglycosylase D
MRTSEIAKRFGIREHDLRQINRIPPSVLIKAGSTVLVPRTEDQKSNVPEHVADHGSIQFQAETRLQKTTVRVGKGDTLASVAHRLKISLSDLAEWNRLSPQSKLQAGQNLVIFKQVSVPVHASANVASKIKSVAGSPKKRIVPSGRNSKPAIPVRKK